MIFRKILKYFVAVIVSLLMIFITPINTAVYPILECNHNNTYTFSYINSANTSVQLNSYLTTGYKTYNNTMLFYPGSNKNVFTFDDSMRCNNLTIPTVEYVDDLCNDDYLYFTIMPSNYINNVNVKFTDHKKNIVSMYLKKHYDDNWYLDNLNGHKFRYLNDFIIEFRDGSKASVFVNTVEYNDKKSDCSSCKNYKVFLVKKNSNNNYLDFKIVPKKNINYIIAQFYDNNNLFKNQYLNKNNGPNSWGLTLTSGINISRDLIIKIYMNNGNIITRIIDVVDIDGNVCTLDKLDNVNNKCHINNTLCEMSVLNNVQWNINNNGIIYSTINSKFSKDCRYHHMEAYEIFILASKWNNRVIDIKDGVLEQGIAVQVWDYVTGSNQKWYFEYDVETGTYLIKTLMNNKCLSVINNEIKMMDCHDENHQKFFINEVNKNEFEIKSYIEQKCLDIKDWNPNNGAQLQLWECTTYPNQIWNIIKSAVNIGSI
jgi:hypothetical protein